MSRLFSLDESNPWLLPALLVLFSGAILGTAMVSEVYGETLRIFNNQNLEPCPLCTVQRFPYAAIVILGIATALLSGKAMERTLLLGLMSMFLVFGSYIAGFHVGVEYTWWEAGDTCTSGIDDFMLDLDEEIIIESNPDAIRPAPNCADAAWRFPGKNGLSMAGFNFLASTAMAIATITLTLASLGRLQADD